MGEEEALRAKNMDQIHDLKIIKNIHNFLRRFQKQTAKEDKTSKIWIENKPTVPMEQKGD